MQIRSKEGRSERVSQREAAIDSAKAREIRLNQFSPGTKAVPTFVEEMSASLSLLTPSRFVSVFPLGFSSSFTTTQPRPIFRFPI
ncbi:hypothetical protein TNCV_3105781 [Trichonephila clavipes]|nr:hypothetical protein TNCV_3105781 [Trichonephila clavipes]